MQSQEQQQPAQQKAQSLAVTLQRVADAEQRLQVSNLMLKPGRQPVCMWPCQAEAGCHTLHVSSQICAV